MEPNQYSSLALVWPSVEHLPSYVAALERGWSPDNIRGIEATREQLVAIAEDPEAFLSSLVFRSPDGAFITLPDGSKAAASTGLSALAVGRRVLRIDRLPLATGHERAASTHSRTHRICGRTLEAAPRLRDARVGPNAGRREGRRTKLSGDHDRSRQHRVAARG